MVCVGEAYKHQLKQMWQIADVQSLYASRCGLARLLNTLISSQKEKKQNKKQQLTVCPQRKGEAVTAKLETHRMPSSTDVRETQGARF